MSSRVLQDALENLFGQIKWMAGNDKSFGALTFIRILRNLILGAGDIVPKIRNSNVAGSPEFGEDTEESFTTSGFEACTEELVTKIESTGKIIVNTVMDEQADEIIDFTDTDETIHFELPDEMSEEHCFTQCGMIKLNVSLHFDSFRIAFCIILVIEFLFYVD